MQALIQFSKQKEQLSFSLLQDIVFWAEGKACDVLVAFLGDDEDVMFPVAACAGLAVGDHDHRLHGNHHVWFQYRVDVFSQFKRCNRRNTRLEKSVNVVCLFFHET